MLSPHEFATLILIRNAPDQVELGSAELGVLLERRLVSLENLASGRLRLHVTTNGNSILKAVARVHQRAAENSSAPDEVAESAFTVPRRD